MGDTTDIAWTDATFNPWWGCTKVSPGCTHCYAETWANRWGNNVWGLKADRRLFGHKHWKQPLNWNADAAKAGTRRKVFCASMADVFENRADLEPERQKLWELIEQTPNLDWQLLTKRPEHIAKMLPNKWLAYPLPNVWLGVTAEDQEHANWRIPMLLDVPAHTHFISVEPQIGPVTLSDIMLVKSTYEYHQLSWVICGGESGAGARDFDLEWARSLRDESRELGVAFFMKQLGGHPKKNDKLEDLPEDLRIREFPVGNTIQE